MAVTRQAYSGIGGGYRRLGVRVCGAGGVGQRVSLSFAGGAACTVAHSFARRLYAHEWRITAQERTLTRIVLRRVFSLARVVEPDDATQSSRDRAKAARRLGCWERGVHGRGSVRSGERALHVKLCAIGCGAIQWKVVLWVTRPRPRRPACTPASATSFSEITAGTYPAWSALLPSIREIMERWEVSTTTARKVLDELAAAGYAAQGRHPRRHLHRRPCGLRQRRPAGEAARQLPPAAGSLAYWTVLACTRDPGSRECRPG